MLGSSSLVGLLFWRADQSPLWEPFVSRRRSSLHLNPGRASLDVAPLGRLLLWAVTEELKSVTQTGLFEQTKHDSLLARLQLVSVDTWDELGEILLTWWNLIMCNFLDQMEVGYWMVFHFSVNHWCLLLTNWVVFTLDYSTSLLLHCKLLSCFRLSTSSCFFFPGVAF